MLIATFDLVHPSTGIGSGKSQEFKVINDIAKSNIFFIFIL